MLEEFQQNGFVVIKNAFERSACESMVDEIWQALETTSGMQREDRSTWRVEQPRGLSFLRKSGTFDAIGSNVVVETINTLLGTQTWLKPDHWGGALVTFPSSGAWQIPDSGWHIDYPARGDLETPFAVKMLGLLTDMETRGGATLLARKSHHLVRQLVAETHDRNAGSSSQVRKKLVRSGIDLKQDLFEFVGKAGDVVLFDPWLFHNASRNVRDSPRLMVEQNLPSNNALTLYDPNNF